MASCADPYHEVVTQLAKILGDDLMNKNPPACLLADSKPLRKWHWMNSWKSNSCIAAVISKRFLL